MNFRLSSSEKMPHPSQYVEMLNGSFSQWALNETRAPLLRGRWREEVFAVAPDVPLDLEIGTGNGLFFSHRAQMEPTRQLVGLEIKFKPLIQTIRRAVREGATNARVVRYHAALVPELFQPGELNDVFIFFPDPWPRTRSFKHRLIQDHFLSQLFELQRPGSQLIFKTDHLGYFEWALERFQRSSYTVHSTSRDLHHSEFAQGNFMTQFERLWLSKGLKINYMRLLRN